MTRLLAGVIVMLAALAAPAAAAPAVAMKARIQGRDLASVDQNQPLRLRPDQLVVVDLSVTNNTGRDLAVRSVNLNGKVMGLTFFSFETRIDLLVSPGVTESRRIGIELVGLNGQATGLLPGSLELLGTQRQVLVSRDFATDVDGSLASVYGVFGALVAAITVLLMLGLVVRLITHRMSVNRWSRGAHFAAAGLGLGLTLTFSLSDFRVLLPDPGSWLTIVAVSTVALFVVGYLTPKPTVYFLDDEEVDGVGVGGGMATSASVR